MKNNNVLFFLKEYTPNFLFPVISERTENSGILYEKKSPYYYLSGTSAQREHNRDICFESGKMCWVRALDEVSKQHHSRSSRSFLLFMLVIFSISLTKEVNIYILGVVKVSELLNNFSGLHFRSNAENESCRNCFLLFDL